MRSNPAVMFLTALLMLPMAAGSADHEDPPAQKAPGEPAVGGSPPISAGVFYLTNRKRQEDGAAGGVYGGERGGRQFGRCEVEFTPIPVINSVAAKMPFYLPGESSEMLSAERLDAREFWDRLADALEGTSSGSVVVFVHGYNYGFQRTCRMAAALQRSLNNKARVLMFSWPSNGSPADYVRDQADLEWSVPLLANFLLELGNRIGRQNVQLLAHSLGSRGVFFALQRMGGDLEARPLIGRLVLLAPDFDTQTFLELWPRLAPLTAGVTLYASENDTPLKVSRKLSGHPRLGEAGEFLTVIEGMETIDVSPAGRYQILGHEYFYFHPRVAADLAQLLGTGASAAKRSNLYPTKRDGIPYWEIRD